MLTFFEPHQRPNLEGTTTYKRIHTRVSIGRLTLQWAEDYQNFLTLVSGFQQLVPASLVDGKDFLK